MSPKRSSINLSITEAEKQALERLAAKLQIFWGDKPNVSQLLKRIAQDKLRVVVNDDWSADRIETFDRIRGLLNDRGDTQEALAIADLLLERSELSIPLRKELNAFMVKSCPSWRLRIEQLR